MEKGSKIGVNLLCFLSIFIRSDFFWAKRSKLDKSPPYTHTHTHIHNIVSLLLYPSCSLVHRLFYYCSSRYLLLCQIPPPPPPPRHLRSLLALQSGPTDRTVHSPLYGCQKMDPKWSLVAREFSSRCHWQATILG